MNESKEFKTILWLSKITESKTFTFFFMGLIALSLSTFIALSTPLLDNIKDSNLTISIALILFSLCCAIYLLKPVAAKVFRKPWAFLLAIAAWNYLLLAQTFDLPPYNVTEKQQSSVDALEQYNYKIMSAHDEIINKGLPKEEQSAELKKMLKEMKKVNPTFLVYIYEDSLFIREYHENHGRPAPEGSFVEAEDRFLDNAENITDIELSAIAFTFLGSDSYERIANNRNRQLIFDKSFKSDEVPLKLKVRNRTIRILSVIGLM